MNCKNGHLMHSHDDVNFECLKPGCGEVKYLASNKERILKLITPQSQGGLGRPTCLVCGRVMIPNNGGFGCIHCSSYYEMPNAERPPRLWMLPREKKVEPLPGYLAVAMVLLAGNLVVAGALFFGG